MNSDSVSVISLSYSDDAESDEESIHDESKSLNKQILNRIISLNSQPYTILIPAECVKQDSNASSKVAKKIPRPANAFMLYANENRKVISSMYPKESNKEISCRLGNIWKKLSCVEKDKYYSLAKTVDAEHKRKYPDYVYNPKEARIKKAIRERERSMGASQMSSQMGSQRARRSPHWPKPPMPMHVTPTHSDLLLNAPGKEMRTAIRAEMEHGFLARSNGYAYQAHEYPFPPQSDYATYVQVTPPNWVPNTYIQPNPMTMQQQMWNQYQAERFRIPHNQVPPLYMMNPQESVAGQQSDYMHVEHLPSTSNNMMHEIAPGPSNISHRETEVDRYLNAMPSDTNSKPSTVTSNNTDAGNNNTGEMPIVTETSSNNVINDSAVEVNESEHAVDTNELSMPLGDTLTDDRENAIDGSDNGMVASSNEFTGMTFLEDDRIADISTHDLHKTINGRPGTLVSIPLAHSNLHYPKAPEFFSNPYSMNKSAASCTLTKKHNEFPLDFSCYKTVATEPIGKIAYQSAKCANQSRNIFVCTPQQYEMGAKFLTEMKCENDYILDLSKK